MVSFGVSQILQTNGGDNGHIGGAIAGRFHESAKAFFGLSPAKNDGDMSKAVLLGRDHIVAFTHSRYSLI